jgi:hypothetical protein
MRYYLFRFMCVISATIFVTSVWWWIRSYWHYDVAGHSSGHYGSWIETRNGTLNVLRVSSQRYSRPAGWHYQTTRAELVSPPLRPFPLDRRGTFAGFIVRRTVMDEYLSEGIYAPPPGGSYTTTYTVAGPFWLIAILSSVLPAAWLMARVRHRNRRMNNRCTICGYNLRASNDRCPECGTPFSLGAS